LAENSVSKQELGNERRIKKKDRNHKMTTITLEDLSPPSWSTTLSVDAMYFHAAKKCYEASEKALKGIEKTKRAFAKLREKEARIKEKFDNDLGEAYDKLEPIYIQMESAEYLIGAAYGPYLQNISITHILCATAAEAHINVIAKGRLKGKFKEIFDKISLEGKWLLLPKILGKKSFDQGSEPFQSFSKLIKYRNELIHYKGRSEEWEGFEYGEPRFLKKLGLSLTEAENSLKTVSKMIIEISKMINSDPPHWLRKGYDDLPDDITTNFFDVIVER
jgi:hypothetical protein